MDRRSRIRLPHTRRSSTWYWYSVGDCARDNTIHSWVRDTNLETSAWGRAIGALGIGIDASIATLDEIQHAKERSKVIHTSEKLEDDPWVTDAPVAQEQTDTPTPNRRTTTKGSSMYPATEGQVKAIHAILGKKGIREDIDKLAAVNEWLIAINKPTVPSITSLNKHDASGLIDHIQAPP